MIEILRRLSGDETLCRRISKGALIAGRRRSWKQSFTEVIDFLDQRIGAPETPAVSSDAAATPARDV
jgi:hypothetical protein